MLRLVRVFAPAMALVVCAAVPAVQAQTPLIVTMSLSTGKAMSGETVSGTLRASSAPAQNRTFRLESSPTSLVKINGEPEVVLRAGTTSVGFSVNVVPSLVKTSVSIRAVEITTTTATQPSSASLEIYPALIRIVRISGPSMVGTRGASLTATVELNAPAPSGGTQVYPLMSFTTDAKPTEIKALSVGSSTTAPRIAAGSRTVTIPIPYNALLAGGHSVSSDDAIATETKFVADFNASTAHVALVVGIDPPTSTAAAQVTPGLSGRVTFDVVPFRVNSNSVQPSSVSAGNEAAVTLTLSAPAGSNEVLELTPAGSTRAWARLVGTSCQAQVSTTRKGGLAMPLTAGATTQSFKVCTGATASGSQTVTVLLRSGPYPITVSVQP